MNPSARYVVPSFLEVTPHGARETNPYAKLFDERIIFLGAPIDSTSANDIIVQLLCLEAADAGQDIVLYINSPGGSFTALTAIYDTMQFIGPDVQTVCVGEAGSAAAVLLAAGAPGKRAALPHARIVLNQPVAEDGFGQVSDIAIQAEEVERMRALLEDIISLHSGRPVDSVRADVDREKVLTAQAALAYGVVDRVLDTRKRSVL